MATTLHLGFAFALALLSAGFGFYSVKWIDGERQIRGSFSLKSRMISRFKKGRASIAFLAVVPAFLLGLRVGLLIPVGVQLVAFIVLVVVALVLLRLPIL